MNGHPGHPPLATLSLPTPFLTTSYHGREDEFQRVRAAGAMVFTRSQLDAILKTGALPPPAPPTKADPPRLYNRSGMSAGCVFTRSLGDRSALCRP